MNVTVKQFDWQNLIIVNGSIYAKTTREISNPSSNVNNVCELCELKELCSFENSRPCDVVGAANAEYMTEVGRLLIKTFQGEIRMEIFDDFSPM